MTDKNFFSTCRTVDDAKKLYRDLMKEHHPDHGGSVEMAKQINAEFDAFCERATSDGFNQYRNDTGRTAYADPTMFANILKKAIRLNCRIEIIGYWIYAFESYEVREDLRTLGFWFSKKHRAWIYNGQSKAQKYRVTKLSTNQVKQIHGSTVVREHEERTAIA